MQNTHYKVVNRIRTMISQCVRNQSGTHMIVSLKLISSIFRIGSIQQLMLSSHPSIIPCCFSWCVCVCRQHSPVLRVLDVSPSSIDLYVSIFNCAHYQKCVLLKYICDRACENRACGHKLHPVILQVYLSTGTEYLHSVTCIITPITCFLRAENSIAIT